MVFLNLPNTVAITKATKTPAVKYKFAGIRANAMVETMIVNVIRIIVVRFCIPL